MKLNILISRPYIETRFALFIKDNERHLRILVDSGAFTYWKKGIVHDVADYIAWVDTLPFQPYGYFQLDRIGDAKVTIANLDAQLRAGQHPLPIWTRGAPVSDYTYMRSVADLVGIGSGPGTEGQLGYLRWAFEHAIEADHVHVLGLANHNLITHYRPASVDATTWLAARNHGQLRVYRGGGRWSGTYVNPWTHRNDPPSRKHLTPQDAAALRAQGFDPALLKVKESWRNDTVHRMQIGMWMAYAEELKAHVGTDMYFVSFNLDDYELAMQLHHERGCDCP